ncbi:hypothetical protein HOY80DRAFT_1134312 [Tuber brumale]|nr:hypothetical protein HOY80DRAFT_1134312 [Tuber brumale]
MADILERPDHQTPPQPDMENVLRGIQNITTGTTRVANTPAFNQGAEILALLRRLQQGQIVLQKGQAALQQGQDSLREGQATLQRGQAGLQGEQAALQEGQAEILQQVEGLRDDGFHQDKNSIARVIDNSASFDGTPLEPFYGVNGQLVPNSPATLGHAKRLRSDRVDALLVALGL